MLRKPAFWIWLLAGVAFWPLLIAFSNVALTTQEGAVQATLYEFAFISLQVGGLLGLGLLDRNRAIFLRTSPGRRLVAEATAMGTACLLALGAGLLVPMALGIAGQELLPARLPLHFARALTTYALIAMVVLHLPLGPWMRAALLPFLTWFLPTLINPESVPASWIQRVFGVAGQLLPDELHSKGQVAYPWCDAPGLLSLLGWALLAWATIPSLPREYALRDPR